MTTRREPIDNDQPQTRRERRAAQRAARSGQRTSSKRSAQQPMWRSPIVLFTVAALVVGAGIIGFALLTRPATPTDDIVAPSVEVPANLADGRTLGSPDAPVTVDVWADFQCPGCRQMATRVEPPLIASYVIPGYAKMVFHDAAFQGAKAGTAYDESVEAAAAARCGEQQGMFWQMHDWIFANWNGENEGAFRADRLRAIAEHAGLDMTQYDACMASGGQQAAVRAETQDALSQGINQTPSVFINGTLYTGTVSVPDLGAAIMDAAGGATPAPVSN